MVSAGANQELDKIKEFNKVTNDPDYCSFCAGFKSKMVSHKIAHKLKYKIHSQTIPEKPDLEKEMELLNAYHWYRQDASKPEHLRPIDPRLEKFLERKSERDHENES